MASSPPRARPHAAAGTFLLLAAALAAVAATPLPCGSGSPRPTAPSAFAKMYLADRLGDFDCDTSVALSVPWNGCVQAYARPGFYAPQAVNSVAFHAHPKYGLPYVTLTLSADPFCGKPIFSFGPAGYQCCVKASGDEINNQTISSWST